MLRKYGTGDGQILPEDDQISKQSTSADPDRDRDQMLAEVQAEAAEADDKE